MKHNFHNFILFWLSQSVSQLGSSMTSFALIIWAYEQTNSAMRVSLMTFFSYLPYILVSIFAGAFIDASSKKKIMLCADGLAAVCTFVVLVLLLLGKLQIWHIYIVNGITGLMNSFQSPAESVALGLMIPKEKYEKASGMNSFSSSLLMVVAPTLAVFVHSIFGLQGVIVVDLLTFFFAFIILLKFIEIREDLKRIEVTKNSILAGCNEGITFLLQHKGIWYLIISMAFMNFFSRLTYENILSPMILARSGGSEKVLGIVNGILGIGGILGGVYVSFKKVSSKHVKSLYFFAAISFLFGDLLMGIGQTTFIWCIAALAASVPVPFINAAQNVILYNKIPSQMQGRVFAVRNALQFSTIPIGILLGGALADYVFEPFMNSDNTIAIVLSSIVGSGNGSGMAVMFLMTGILGFFTCVIWYRNKDIQKLE